MNVLRKDGKGELLTDGGPAVPVRYRLEATRGTLRSETLPGPSTGPPGLRRCTVNLTVLDTTELGKSIQTDVSVRLALENGDEIEGTIGSQDQSRVTFEVTKKGHQQLARHFGLET